jgi:predicted ferric reductase
MSRRKASYVLAAIVLFPLVPWLTAGSLHERLSGGEAVKSVANLSAFFGIAAWATALLLASRIRVVERAVGGIENLYPLHRRLGELAVVLATMHAVFLTVYARGDALDIYVPAAGWSVFSGVVALGLLIGFVIATVARRLSYQRFLIVQRCLGATFLLGAFHSLAVHGTKTSAPALTVYVGCLTAAALAGLGYRWFGARLGIGRHWCDVEEVRRLGDDVVEIAMVAADRELQFEAGQFVYASFHQDGIPRESHPFTIASAPGAGPIRLVVKRLGDFTGSVMTLRPGARAQLEGPFGAFLRGGDPARPQTWIAGGIGITPFLSWARSLNATVAADLYYCTPAAEHAHFVDELYDIADRYPAFRVIPIRKVSLGHLRVSDVAAVNPNLSRGEIFICGPPALVDNLTAGLVASGILPHHIHSETFDFR